MSKRYLTILFGLALSAGCGGGENVPSSVKTNAGGFHALEKISTAPAERLGKPPKSRAIRDLPSWVTIPGGAAMLGSREPDAPPPRETSIRSFWMTRTEITTAQFARFLNDTGRHFDSPQFAGVPGRYAPLVPREPVAYVSHADASDYAEWISDRLQVDARLPTADEWEYAARGGVVAAPYPWGWAAPDGRAAFNLARARPVGCYPPNPFLLYDMAGNLAEWCAAEDDSGRAPVCGGSWSERSDQLLRVWRRVPIKIDYRDADVGFRILARPRS